MLSSAYDILELFEAAFSRSRSIPATIQIDCSGKTRYAEGTKDFVAWRIEADIFNRTPKDIDQLRMGYAHMGEHLLAPFYAVAKEKVKGFGWSGDDIEKHAFTAMAPVLSAMHFHMGMAAKRGWLDSVASQDNYGNVRHKPADFTLEQAVSWTRLGKPGRWSSMELMSMLVSLEERGHALDEPAGQAWVASHQPEHQAIAKRMLDTVFAPDRRGKHSVQIDDVAAVHAWKSWWMLMPPTSMGKTPLGQLENFTQKKTDAMVEGWYVRVAQSKDMGRRSIASMGHLFHGFPTPKAWKAFADTLAVVIHSHSSLVWKDKEAQAWMLHRAVRKEGALDHLAAMQNNRVHDYLTISRSLDSTRRPHEFYPLWCQLQARPTEAPLDAQGLFDDTTGQPGNT